MKKIMALIILVSIILAVSVDVYAQHTVRQKVADEIAAEEWLAVKSSAKTLGFADSTEPEIPETVKADIAVSRKNIGQQIIECKSELKEIVKDAEASLKKISEKSKAREKEMTQEKAEEEIAKRKAEKEIAAKKAEKEIAERKTGEEITKKKAEKEIAERKAGEEIARKKAEEEMAVKKAEKEKLIAEQKAAEAKKAADRKAAREAAAKVQVSPAAIAEEAARKVSSSVTKQIAASLPPVSTAAIQSPPEYAQAASARAPAVGEEVSAIYKDAVALYWDSKYSEAKMKFEQVQKASPEYARTSYYLRRVKEKLSN